MDQNDLLRGLVLRAAVEYTIKKAESMQAPLISRNDIVKPGGDQQHQGIEIKEAKVGEKVWSDCDHVISGINKRLEGGTVLATEAGMSDETGEVYFEFTPSKNVQVWVLYDQAYSADEHGDRGLPPWLHRNPRTISKAAQVRTTEGEIITFSAYMMKSEWKLGTDGDGTIALPHNRHFSGMSPRDSKSGRRASNGMTYWVVLMETISFKDEMDFSPYCVRADLPVFRAHMLFQRLGLRHLVVVDNRHKPIGVLTRASFIEDHDNEEEGTEEAEENEGLDQSYASFAREMLRSHKSCDATRASQGAGRRRLTLRVIPYVFQYIEKIKA